MKSGQRLSDTLRCRHKMDAAAPERSAVTPLTSSVKQISLIRCSCAAVSPDRDGNPFAELTFVFVTEKSLIFEAQCYFHFFFLFTYTSSLAAEVERAGEEMNAASWLPEPLPPPAPLPHPAVLTCPSRPSHSFPRFFPFHPPSISPLIFFPSSFPPIVMCRALSQGPGISQVPSYPSVQ